MPTKGVCRSPGRVGALSRSNAPARRPYQFFTPRAYRFARPNQNQARSSRLYNVSEIFSGIETFHCTIARLPGQPRPVAQHFFNRGLCLTRVSHKTESMVRRKITSCARVLRNDRPPESEKSCSAIADPAGSPCHINAFDRGEFTDRAGQVAAIRPRRPRDLVRIDNFPAEPL